jgi:hypothetical protein
MKHAIFFLITLALSSSAFAEPKTYTGKSSYQITNLNDPLSLANPGSFNELEQLGVQRAAEQNAQAQCSADGASDCVIMSSSITACNYQADVTGVGSELKCDGQAVVHGRKE